MRKQSNSEHKTYEAGTPQNSKKHEKAREAENQRLKGHKNCMQCMYFDWIILQENRERAESTRA